MDEQRNEHMDTSSPWRPRVLATAALVLVLVAGAAPTSGALSTGRFESVGDAVSGGIVDVRVASDLEAHGSADALVAFSYEDVLAQAKSAAIGLRSPDKAAAVLAVTRPAYSAEKEAALSGVAGVEPLRNYDSLPVSFVRFTSSDALLTIANSPEVVSVLPNETLQAQLVQSLPLIQQPDAAAAGRTGSGTAVAVLDTGVDYTRAAFGSCTSPGGACKVAYAHDFAPDDGMLDDPSKGYHGTNVGGVVVGVAPNANVLALDVFDGPNPQTPDVTAAINWVVSTQGAYNTRAMNLSMSDASFHTGECTTSWASAPFASARAVGILPVVASGDNAAFYGGYTNGVGNPACAPGAVRVGAVYDSDFGYMDWGPCAESTAADKIACWSQGGPLLTLLAPGAWILAAGEEYWGTSQAAPHVAGAAAVLAAAVPGASLAQITNALTSTGPSVSDPRTGLSYHRLNLWQAVQALASAGHTLSVAVNGSGAVSSNPAGINCPGVCSADYSSGTGVALTATPAGGWSFTGWSGDCSGATNPCTVSMTTARNVAATFTPTGPPSSTAKGKLLKYYGTSGIYRLYHASSRAPFKVTVLPNHEGKKAMVEGWRWDGSHGKWVKAGSKAYKLDKGSTVIAYASGSVGVKYAIRATFAGDADHAGSTTDWSYFQFTG